MKFRRNLQKRAVSVVLAIAMVMGCTFNTAAAESGASAKEPQEVTKSYDSGNVTMTNTLKGDSDEYTVNLKIKIKNISKFPSAKSLAAAGVDAAATDKDEGDTTPTVNDDPQDTASSAPAVSSQPETAPSGEAPVVSEPASSDTDDTASQPALTAAAKTAAVKAPADEITVGSKDNDEPENVTSSAAPDTSVESAPEGKTGDASVDTSAPEKKLESEEPAQEDKGKESEPEEPESYEVRYYIPTGFSLKTVPNNADEEDGYVSFADLTAEDLQSFSTDLQLEPTGEEEKDSQETDTKGQSGLYVDGNLLFAFGEMLEKVEKPTVTRTVSLDNWNDRTYHVDLSITAKSPPSTGTKPCDIVLVLDRSGSMGEHLYTPVPSTNVYRNQTYYIHTGSGEEDDDYTSVSYSSLLSSWCYYWFIIPVTVTPVDKGTGHNNEYQFYTRSDDTKMKTLKDAATDFVDSVAANSPDSKIAVVSFGSDVRRDIELTTLDDNHVNDIKDAINGLNANGGTRSYYGLEMARGIYDADVDYNPDKRDRVVIMFTDGEPGDYGFSDDTYYEEENKAWYNGYMAAAATINQSKVLQEAYNTPKTSDEGFNKYKPPKKNKDTTDVTGNGCSATVYTVGLFSNLSPDTKVLVDDYMTQVASEHKYLQTSADLSLDDIFKQISDEVGNISGAIVTDVIDPRFDVVGDDDNALAVGDKVTDPTNDDIKGTVGVGTSGEWTITWHTNEIKVNESPGWETSYRVRAKPQFVGGNNIPINTDGANVVYTAEGDKADIGVQSVNVKPRFFVKNAETTLFYGELPGTTSGIPALSNSFPYPYTTDSYDVTDGIPQGNEITGDGMYLGVGSTGDFNTAWTPLNNAPLVNEVPSIEAFDPHGASDSNLAYTVCVTFDPDYVSTDEDQQAADTNTHDNTGDRHAENLPVDGAYTIHVKTGTLTIHKIINGDTSSADPNPYFTFKIERFSTGSYTGTPLSTSYQVVYNNDKSGNADIHGLPCGYYKVTEIPNSGWRYRQDGEVQYDGQYLGRTSAAPSFSQSISATVHNTLGNPYWISGKDSVQNSFQVTAN